ncbi:ABC transporter ATP-binding protein [Vagococcus xieshaowenii]|uniref:ABC transporter ATP-binding protein n=1 Tax=Vagococcus xieshaowenii TaxID=2562451 RepID=A0A4Z0DAX2_9ENTE|nr:ABC transporter ATP-binding protein [Vagococcus xieshaowenii]QCA29301.1 ABC transporter ATP-binding protein [Vagococcus xieshaowenii]TFZ42004.1 ABC transporter ATP-binding protein [Vagococcus xieshaowenii]
MKLMLRYTLKHKKLLFLNFLCVFGFIMIELGLPTLLASMIDKGILENDTNYVKKIGLLMLLVTAVGMVLHLGLTYVGSRLTTLIVMDIRDDMYRNVQTFSHHEYEQLGVSSLITRITNDAYQVMLFLGMVLRTGFMTPMMFIGSMVMIVSQNASLAKYVLMCLPILILGVYVIAKFSEPLSKRQQSSLDKINRIVRENLTGLRVVRAFVNEKFQESRFKKVNEKYTKNSINLYTLMSTSQPAFFLVFNIVMVVLIWVGAKQIEAGSLQVGSLVAFIEYIFHALFSFMMFASVFMMFPRAEVSANRIQEVLDAKSDILINEEGIKETKTQGVIAFHNVSFAYEETESPVIRNVSFEAKPGETVAFIGSTGSGKSTLIQLLPRFYDVTKGEILIDGVNVKDYYLPSLREKIGYIPQKALLFSGTIRDNLLFGKPDATEEELAEALAIAQATDFVSKKEKGLDEVVSEGGSNFSGGQKQRLAIARALIRKPAIYVFDDSFSALDYATDAQLRQQLKAEVTNSTVLIVAQRVSTIMDADKIIVLNEGEVVGQGTHRELLESNDIYYDIASSQLSQEELLNG